MPLRVLVEWAEGEGRVLLTRDAKLLKRRLLPPGYSYLVQNTDKKEQLKEVRRGRGAKRMQLNNCGLTGPDLEGATTSFTWMGVR